MSTSLQTTSGNTLSDLVKNPRYASRINEVLKERSPQFVSSLLQVGNSLGADCEPTSIIASAMTAAALNLPIDKNLGFAWIVPYRGQSGKVAQFQMGYKGYIQLALRTGQYARLNVCEVYEGELEKYDRLTGDLVINSTLKKSDKIVGYASYLKLVSGFEHAEYWTSEEVEAHAKRYSKAYSGGRETPWKTHFDEMAMKTVLGMHIRKWGPMTTQEMRAHMADNAVIRDLDADPEFLDNPTEPVEKPTKPSIVKKKTETAPAQTTTIEVTATPAEEDNIDTSPETPPATAPTAEAVKIGPSTGTLIDFASANEIGWEEFKRWFANTFGRKDAEGWADWNAVPEADAALIINEPKKLKNMKLICGKN